VLTRFVISSGAAKDDPGAALNAPRVTGRRAGGGSRVGRLFTLALVVASVPVVFSLGCEALLTADVPAYSCSGIAADVACAAGQVCLSGSCVEMSAVCELLKCPIAQCDSRTATCDRGAVDGSIPSDADATTTPPVDAADAADSAPRADATSPPDAGPLADADASVTCRGIGCRCAGASDCDSAVCGDVLTLTNDVVTLTNSNVCTKACCTSLDCDPGSVCFGAGTGGNYCLRPEVLGRDAPVTRGAPGSACTADTQCASSRCVTGLCADTCCSAAATECSGSTTCSMGTFPGKVAFDTHSTFSCVLSRATGASGDSCSRNTDCRSNVCDLAAGGFSTSCRSACRNSSECGTGYECHDVKLSTSNNDLGIYCFPASRTGVKAALGATCGADTDCRSGTCDTQLKACTDACFSTADCAAAPGWRCRPTVVTLKSGGSFKVLACGP
jgi:hypothetical protein